MQKTKIRIVHTLPPDVGQKFGTPCGRCQGGNGYVYKCRRKSDGAICAVKVLKNLRGDAGERFRREIKIVIERNILMMHGRSLLLLKLQTWRDC